MNNQARPNLCPKHSNLEIDAVCFDTKCQAANDVLLCI